MISNFLYVRTEKVARGGYQEKADLFGRSQAEGGLKKVFSFLFDSPILFSFSMIIMYIYFFIPEKKSWNLSQCGPS